MELDTSDNNGFQEPIRSFSSAIAALKEHSFIDETNFQLAANSAKDLYARTHETINTTDISNLQAVLSTLDPKEHFLAYISTLHASLAAIERDSPIAPSMLRAFAQLVKSTDGRWARAVPQRWVGIGRHATRLAIDIPSPMRAISLVLSLHEAADKLVSPPPSVASTTTTPSSTANYNTSNTTNRLNNTIPSSSSSSSSSSSPASPSYNPSQSDELVPLHADLLALCIHAKYYRYASKWILAKRRLHVNPSVSQLSATDVHLIYHYSTWIHIGMKNFSAGLQTCRLALVVPAPSPGTFFPVVVTTYRLYVLLHLLVVGKCPPPLKFSSHQVGPLRKMCSEYIELGHAFESNDLKNVLAIVEHKRESFFKHETLGIVKQVVQAVYKRLVDRMSNCYVKMTIKQMADKLQLKNNADAQRLLFQMIQQNQLNASIDQQHQAVKLSILDDTVDHQQLTDTVSQHYMRQCLDIMTRLQRFIDDVECDPDYIRKDLAGQRKQTTASARAFAGGGPPGLALGMADIEAEFMR